MDQAVSQSQLIKIQTNKKPSSEGSVARDQCCFACWATMARLKLMLGILKCCIYKRKTGAFQVVLLVFCVSVVLVLAADAVM